MPTIDTPLRLGYHELPIGQLQPSALNPRRHVTGLDDLAASIAEKGILEPLLARPVDQAHDAYEIVAGERRYRAALQAGVALVPVILRELTDAQVIELAIIENNQRQDVHPLDEAEAFAQLRSLDRAYAPEVIAAKIGRPVAYVKGRLKLLDLVPEVRDAFLADQITIGHAERIARLAPDQQVKALQACFAPLFSYDPDAEDDLDDLDDDDLDALEAGAAAAPRGPIVKPGAVLKPVAALETWVREHVVLDPKSPEVQEQLPQLAEQVERAEAAGATLVQLSTAYRAEHGLKGKAAPLPQASWREVEGKPCKAAVQGVVVYGSDKRAQILTVCLKSSKCPKHWPPQPARDDSGWKAQQEKWREQQEREERARKLWLERQPQVYTAVAAHLAGRAVDISLVADIVKDLGATVLVSDHIGAITEANLGQVLAFAFITSDNWWNQDAAERSLKGTGFDLKKFLKTLPPPPAEPAPKKAAKTAKAGKAAKRR